MSSFKIFEIANELNTTSDKLMAICKKIGIKVKSNGSSIDVQQKKMLIDEFKSKPARSEKKTVAEKILQPLRKRTVKKAPAKKSTSSKIKWIKISDSSQGSEEETQENQQEEEAADNTTVPVKVKTKKTEIKEKSKQDKISVKETSDTEIVKTREKPLKAGFKKPVEENPVKFKKTEKELIPLESSGKKIPESRQTAGEIKKKEVDASKIAFNKTAKEKKAAAENKLKSAIEEKPEGIKEVKYFKKDISTKDLTPVNEIRADIPEVENLEEDEGFVEIEEEKFIKKALLKEKGTDTFKARQPWNEEKRINIKKVLDRELDKEEKEGRFRTKSKPGAPKKSATAGKVSEKISEKDVEAQEEKSSEKIIRRPEIKKMIEIPEGITIKQLSEKIGISSEEIIQALFNMGEVFNLNQPLDRDVVEILSNEYSFKYSIFDFDDKIDEISQDSEDDLKPRPPIVTVMGHVDHGKTTLLDAIRKSDVASGEAGGITQSIGAYQTEYKGRKITFIDTPGHEAFTSMRARGARVTDIAVIVIAADDGIMPQTIEAINHAKDAGVTIIVAVNKVDLPDANPDKVKQGLTEYELVPEEWGGDTIFVNISAKNKQNIEELLEMIILVADMNDVKGNPSVEGSGIIIESQLDKNLGAIGTLLIRRGRIKTGDVFVTGNSFGRIRTIRDDKGEIINSAEISQPVEISGFSIVPQAGDKFFVVKGEKVAKEIINKREHQKQALKALETKKHITLEDLSDLSKENEIKKLKIVLKSESYGSLDAVEKALRDAEEDNIKLEIIHKAVGAISDSDILLASASDTIVIGFGVVATSKAKLMAKDENVEIRTYNIIYKLIDDIKLASKGLLEPVYEEKIKGNAEVREVFKISKVGIVAGSYILDGEVERGNSLRLVRDGRIVFDGKVESLHRFKEDVKKVNAGYECGIRIENFQDINKGDLLEIYEQVEIPR